MDDTIDSGQRDCGIGEELVSCAVRPSGGAEEGREFIVVIGGPQGPRLT